VISRSLSNKYLYRFPFNHVLEDANFCGFAMASSEALMVWEQMPIHAIAVCDNSIVWPLQRLVCTCTDKCPSLSWMAAVVLCQRRDNNQWYKIETVIEGSSPSDVVGAIVTDPVTMWPADAGLLMSDCASLLCIHQDYPTSPVSLHCFKGDK